MAKIGKLRNYDLMNEQQYTKLCEVCDAILSESVSTDELIAIPCLHVVREHPTILKIYSKIFSDHLYYAYWYDFYKKFFINLAGWAAHFASCRIRQKKFYMNIKSLPKKIDIVFISYLINEDHIKEKEDFYYGDLPLKLAEKGFSVALVLINQTNKSGLKLEKKLAQDNIARILLGSYLDYKTEIVHLFRMINQSQILFNKSLKENDLIKKKVYRLSCVEALNSGTRFGLRIANQIREIISLSQVGAVVVLHEGHSWERLVFSAVKSSERKIKSMGYIHSFIFKLQHALLRPLNKNYNPDYLLTTDNRSKSIVQKNIKDFYNNVEVLGSNRKISILNSDILDINKDRLSRFGPKYCLVAPEGLYDECMSLLRFSLECSFLCPDIIFVWRFHPLIDFKMLESRNKNLRNLPENIIISCKTLKEDLQRSTYILYRGSTIVLQAVRHGLFPLYFRKEDEMTIDPLYELVELNHIIETSDQFSRITESMPELDENYKKIIENYLSNIHDSINYNIIEKILQY